MYAQTFIVAEPAEIAALVGEWLGVANYDATALFCGPLSDNDPAWRPDSYHVLDADPLAQDAFIEPNHTEALQAARSRGQVDWGWELRAILLELARNGRIAAGQYLVFVSF